MINVQIVRRRLVSKCVYDLRWVDPATGQRRSSVAGSNRVLARRAAVERATRVESEMAAIGIPRISDLASAITDWQAPRAVATRDMTRRTLAALSSLVGDAPVASIDRSVVMTFRAQLLGARLAPATVNRHLRVLKSALTLCVDAGWIVSNPLWRWRSMLVPEPDPILRIIEAEEFESLFATAGEPELRLVLQLAYLQGLRRGEIRNLRWSACQLDRRILQCVNHPSNAEWTKSRRNRSMPMRAAVAESLEALRQRGGYSIQGGRLAPRWPHVLTWPDGWRPSLGWLSRWFGRCVRAAGVAPCTLHDLRRSFSTHLRRAGVDSSIIQRLGGWSSPAVLDRYYTGQIDQALRRAMEGDEESRGIGRTIPAGG